MVSRYKISLKNKKFFCKSIIGGCFLPLQAADVCLAEKESPLAALIWGERLPKSFLLRAKDNETTVLL